MEDISSHDMNSRAKIESALGIYSLKKEAVDEDTLNSHYKTGVASKPWTDKLFHTLSDESTTKIKIECGSDKYCMKEEADADNLQSNCLEGNEYIKNEFEAKTRHDWGQIWHGPEQNNEEPHNTDIQGINLNENVQFKLENILGKEVIKDEIDEPDFVSLDALNETQEREKNQLALNNAPTNEQVMNASFYETIREDGSNLEKYKCKICVYQTNNRHYLIRHMERHKDRSKRKLFDCAICSRTYTAKQSLQHHMRLHMDPNEQPTYNCDLCDYKTLYRSNLKEHKLRHANRLKVVSPKSKTEQNGLKYKCNECPFEAKFPAHIVRHNQMHRVSSDREIFKCERCGRACTTKWSLDQHMLLHMDPKDRPTHDCDQCDYKTIGKSKMKLHKLRHGNQMNPDEDTCIKIENESVLDNSVKEEVDADSLPK